MPTTDDRSEPGLVPYRGGTAGDATKSSGPKLHEFELLTLDDVAEVLHCSKAHVSNMVAGKVDHCVPLPAIRLGRRKLVRRATLLRWMEDNDKIAELPESGRKSA